jgi:hypothetical protein
MSRFNVRNPKQRRQPIGNERPASAQETLIQPPLRFSPVGLWPCVIAAGIVGGLISRAVTPDPAIAAEPAEKNLQCETLVCQLLEVRDADNRLLARLGTHPEGGSGLLLFDGTMDHARINLSFHGKTRKAVIELRDDQKGSRNLILSSDGKFSHNLSQ